MGETSGHSLNTSDGGLAPELAALLDAWQLPEGGTLAERAARMVRPALVAGVLGWGSAIPIIGDLQYHLGGAADTAELATLAALRPADRVLDVCCFLGGPAIQLATTVGCHVTGVDRDPALIAAARSLATLCGLEACLAYEQADAAALPFADGTFAVVWNQGSVNHDPAWLDEFVRVLSPGGRLAITFDIRKAGTGPDGPRWTLDEMAAQVCARGLQVTRCQDISARDIVLGWEALEATLSAREAEFVALMGAERVAAAHRRFADEIMAMRADRWGNGRLVARKD
jgi:SAM-dependent methyltransferase